MGQLGDLFWWCGGCVLPLKAFKPDQRPGRVHVLVPPTLCTIVLHHDPFFVRYCCGRSVEGECVLRKVAACVMHCQGCQGGQGL